MSQRNNGRRIRSQRSEADDFLSPWESIFPAGEHDSNLRLRHFMVPVRRSGSSRHRSPIRHRVMERNRAFQYDAFGLPPSPSGFSSDPLGEDSEFSSNSDADEEMVGNGNAQIPSRRNVSSLSDSYAANNENNEMPGTSRGQPGRHSLLENSRTMPSAHIRGHKRRMSSSSESCVETGYSVKYDAAPAYHRFPLAKNLQSLRREEEFTDVVLIVEGKEIPCHRVVLAACSKYFRGLLSSNMKEAIEDKVTITGHKYDIIELIVRHIYAESIHLQADNVQDIVEAADYFHLDQLKADCENFLLRQVAESNCLGLMQFGELHSLNALSDKARKFALNNFLRVSKHEEFLALPLSALKLYISNDALAVQREEHVFDAVVSWLEHEITREQHACEVIKCVRFLFISPQFLFETVAKHSLLQGQTDVQELISEAAKYIALECNEWKQMQLPHTRPRSSYGIAEVLFIVGGICDNRRLHQAEYYNPSNGWVSVADIITPHCTMHSYSVCSQKNNVYVTGGHCNSGLTANAASMYMSNINQWNELAGMLTPRERHGSATVDGAVYVAGGLMASQKGRKKPIVLDQVERYRPSFNRWENVEPLPKRCYSPGVISYKGKLYVIGGVSMTDEVNNTSSKVILNCIQRYDPLTDSWSILPLGQPLARLCCTLFQDHIYMISNNAHHIFKYDPNTCTLEEWRELPEPGLEFAGLATFYGNMVITGGQKDNVTLDKMFFISYSTKGVIQVLKMPRPLCMHGCVAIDKFG